MKLVVSQPESRFGQALELERRGEVVKAISLLESEIFAHPNWDLPRIEVARMQIKTGADLSAAIRHLEVAKTLAPANPRVFFLFGRAVEEQGDLASAIEAMEKALSLRDSYDEARFRLATLYAKVGRWELTEKLMRRYVAEHPESLGARVQWAEALEQIQLFDAAERELGQAVSRSPHSVAFRSKLIEFYVRTGQSEKANRLVASQQEPKALRALQKSAR